MDSDFKIGCKYVTNKIKKCAYQLLRPNGNTNYDIINLFPFLCSFPDGIPGSHTPQNGRSKQTGQNNKEAGERIERIWL